MIGGVDLLKTLGKFEPLMRRSPGLLMGGIGAATGFVGSGFSGWGALAGGALGLAAGSRKNPWETETMFKKSGLKWLNKNGKGLEEAVGLKALTGLGARVTKGLVQGVAIGMGVSALKSMNIGRSVNSLPFVGSPGSSYGSYGRSPYGTSFSGMGNGM